MVEDELARAGAEMDRRRKGELVNAGHVVDNLNNLASIIVPELTVGPERVIAARTRLASSRGTTVSLRLRPISSIPLLQEEAKGRQILRGSALRLSPWSYEQTSRQSATLFGSTAGRLRRSKRGD
jgi:hypothetical protein